jgi:hypothetical protein
VGNGKTRTPMHSSIGFEKRGLKCTPLLLRNTVRSTLVVNESTKTEIEKKKKKVLSVPKSILVHIGGYNFLVSLNTQYILTLTFTHSPFCIVAPLHFRSPDMFPNTVRKDRGISARWHTCIYAIAAGRPERPVGRVPRNLID